MIVLREAILKTVCRDEFMAESKRVCENLVFCYEEYTNKQVGQNNCSSLIYDASIKKESSRPKCPAPRYIKGKDIG